MPSPSHPPRFDFYNSLGEEYKSRSSSLCSFLHSPVTSSFLVQIIIIQLIIIVIIGNYIHADKRAPRRKFGPKRLE
jgi:hypothetical protein